MNTIPKTNLSLEIKNDINTIDTQYTEEDFLQRYQFYIKNYMVESNTRGLLIFHSPGTGKSILAASLSEYYRKHDPNRKIVVLLSKSLQGNFEKNIKKYMQNNKDSNGYEKSKEFIKDQLENKYKFVSLNASNMFQQISKIGKKSTEVEYEKHLEKFNEQVTSSTFLENSLLIIDEVHNLSSGIKNGSKNAVKLYNIIMKTRNIKLLFLTGTPIVNSPFELVPLFNMLKGYIFHNKIKYTLFPENNADFYNFFISSSEIKSDSEIDLKIKNKEMFQNRIIGLVSYYGDFYFQSKKDNFPTEFPIIIEKISMSMQQFQRYNDTRDIENKEKTSFSNSSASESFGFKDNSTSSSSYRIRSRQVSNYCIPDYALEFNQAKTSVTKFIRKITGDDLENLDTFSPKFKKIIENIKCRPDQLSVVFSEFVNGEGIDLFALVLEQLEGYVYWRISDNNQDNDELIDEFGLKMNSIKILQPKKIKTYAVISGNVPISERDAIIKTFNCKENSSGNFISLLLISKSGAEGLSLRNVRSIHVMEPFWNYARVEQIIARGSRLFSHIDLIKSEQNIQPYIYISTYPVSNKDIKERTTDEELLHLSLVRKKIRDQFELAIIESSIDCSANYTQLDKSIKEKLKCYLCVPNNLPLYTVDLNHDLKINNCNPVKEETVNVKKIKIKESDKEFYYTKSDKIIKIFEYDTNIGGYIEMAKNNSLYSLISLKILNIV